MNQNEAVKGAKPLHHKYSSDKPPELVDVGLKMLVKSHSLHGVGLEVPGSVALESAAQHSLGTGMRNMIEASVQNDAAVEILKKEQADFKRVDEILRKLASGEIGGKKNRSASEKKDRR